VRLQQIAADRSHIADLRRSALQDRLRQELNSLSAPSGIGEIRIANDGSDLQSTIGMSSILIEWQAINRARVPESPHSASSDRISVVLHHDARPRLLRGLRLCGGSDGRRGIGWPDEFEDKHETPLALRAFLIC